MLPCRRWESGATRQAHGRSSGELASRIFGGWQGRIAGCTSVSRSRMETSGLRSGSRAYLELADAYPLRDYIPALDPMPKGFRLRECWPETTRGHVHGAARDDDIDYSILNLWLLEQHGFGVTPRRVANACLVVSALFAGIHGRTSHNGQPAEQRADRGDW